MDIFFVLLQKLIPLYIIILLGFLGARFLRITKDSIALILLYIISPVVIFNGVLTTNLVPATLSIPILFFLLCCILSVVSYVFAGFFWKDATRNMLAFTAGTSNTGYFGLPVAVAMFGTYIIGIVALVILGTALYANTVGFFLAAKGSHSTRESFLKVVKLPIVYAFLLAVFINLSGIQLPAMVNETINYFNGAFVILGMMLIGIAIGEIKNLKIDWRYTGFSLVTKYVFWPALMLLMIYLDSSFFHLYDNNLYNVFVLMSVVPVAVGIVSYATILKTHPEKVAVDVLISTLLALVVIPLSAIFLLGY